MSEDAAEYTIVPTGPFLVKRATGGCQGFDEVVTDACETMAEAERLVEVLKRMDRQRCRHLSPDEARLLGARERHLESRAPCHEVVDPVREDHEELPPSPRVLAGLQAWVDTAPPLTGVSDEQAGDALKRGMSEVLEDLAGHGSAEEG